jgi:membrane-bound serine protease (ClpP class)
MALVRVLLMLLLGLPLMLRAEGSAILLDVEGAIGPATSDFVLHGFAEARLAQADLIILRMDTPGGLDSAMRDIIRAILASPIPVATYVAPSGARAASAGTYILYASHLAVMAPGTNLGAATPVQIGGLPSPPDAPEDPETGDQETEDESASDGTENTDDDTTTPEETPKTGKDRDSTPKTAMERKLVNDARAYIRSLAQLRGRNVEWAERAVESAASLSADEALEENVIEIVARDVPDLLEQADGRTVQLSGDEYTLATAAMTVEVISPDWRNQLLAIITNPQVAYILMLIGVYGLFFELSNPGALVPGVLGGICLLLALFAFHVLPINYAGLALLLLGLIFMVGEAFAPSFGALGLGGVVAFVAGSLLLWDETGPGFTVPMGIILGFALASAILLISLSTMLIRQRRRGAVSGSEGLLGSIGFALEDFAGEGRVWVHSESWLAYSDYPVKKDEQVRVISRDGLTLGVQPLGSLNPGSKQ